MWTAIALHNAGEMLQCDPIADEQNFKKTAGKDKGTTA
jgi:hypothetical protein